MNAIPRSVLAVLAISLSLNLFCVGLWTGRHLFHDKRPPHGSALGVRGFLHRSGLDDAEPAVKKIVRARREEIRRQMRALSGARAGVRAALESEPFDPNKLERALSDVEGRLNALQRAMHGSLAEVARTVNAEQRHRMADALWPKARGRPH